MENEYSRNERSASAVTFATDVNGAVGRSGSSARLVRGDELDPVLRRRKDMESADTDGRYIEMFCERYRDRGIAGRVHADAAMQEKREALNRATAPGAYIMTEKLEKMAGCGRPDVYRSGVSDGKRYMTVDDFDRYYHDQRGYKFPQYRTAAVARARESADTERVVADTRARGGSILPKKAGWLTDTDKLPAFAKRLMHLRVFRSLNEWAGETFPRERAMVTESAGSRSRRRPIPVGLVATLVTVAVSMSLVISSTVLVSQSTRELSQLKSRLNEQEEVLGALSDQLDLKNDMLEIERRATEELGMVSEKYLSGQYLGDAPEDYVEIYDEKSGEDKQSGLSALLSAFGFGSD